jgi:lysozyme family protein
VPQSSESSPWLASQRRSRARRFAAHRARLRRWKFRSAVGVLAASLSLAGGALAQGTGNGGNAPAKPVSVKAIQHALGIPADGIAGPQTRRALKRFQREHGLKADGVAGPATLAALGLTGRPQPSTLDSVDDATAELAKIAQCESGGDPTVVSADGRYRGKYQFTRATWKSLGGTGDPAAADEATQDTLAAKLYAQRGSAPWPACG